MTTRLVGYGRLSPEHPAERVESEREALIAHGCLAKNTFIEVRPLSADEWPDFNRTLASLRRGDTLVVTSFSRLVRDLKDLALLATRLQVQGIALHALDWGISTTTQEGALFVKFLAPLVALESSLRSERQREGITLAKAKGSFKGREPTARLKTDQVLELRREGLTIAKIAEALSIGEASVFRIIKDAREATGDTNRK
jgi:DNA invertase Pin-like site-specific DNA recombinase